MKAWQLGLVVAMLIVAGSAAAAPDAETASAKTHYLEGMKRYNIADYGAALEAFKAAYLAKADPVFLFNIGQCQRQLADYGAAEKSYRAFLRESSNTPPGQREQVQKLIAEMEKAQAEARSKQPPLGTQAPPDDAPERAPARTPEIVRPNPADSSTVEARAEAPASPGRTKKIAGRAIVEPPPRRREA